MLSWFQTNLAKCRPTQRIRVRSLRGVFVRFSSSKIAAIRPHKPHKIFFTVLMGVLIPNLEHFISFVGAVTLSLLALFFPAFIETSTFWYKKTGFDFYWMLTRNFFITIFSLMGLIIGGYTSIQSIINSVF